MNWKTVVPLAVALALGGVAAKVGRDMMLKSRQGAGANVKMTKVVIAKEDLAPGSSIKDSEVVVKDMPADAVPTSLTFGNPSDVVGRVVTAQVVKGQPVLSTVLAPKGSAGGVQAMVPAGMRAVTVEVNEVSGVAGLLTPGCRVDVVQTIQQGKLDETALVAKTIVENLQVLAVGRRVSTVSAAPAAPGGAAGVEPETAAAKTVTLLATAAQAEAIDLASHMGTPRLVLRNGSDNLPVPGRGVTVAELRGGDDKETQTLGGVLAQILLGNLPTTRPAEVEPVSVPVIDQQPAAPNYREVEVIRGGASTSVRVNLGNTGPITAGGASEVEKVVPSER
ncbi:MAG TPA: Flp pilus assembly protein CpaB [Tepidisphaeraceae bacterium]|jgi:pilus assembly protein CpaB